MTFFLEKLPLELDVISSDNHKTLEARILISRYDGMVELVDSPEILTTILFMQEAVESGRIEGTIATITDLLDFKVGKKIDERKELDIQEIENYRESLVYALHEVKEHSYNITATLLKNIQYILLNNVRGKDKLRGKFKGKQNYIGNKYDEVTYTPVEPILTNDYIDNLIHYINSDISGDIDPIIKTAIIHAQFELIHPFEDGNGRTGRILIPLLLMKYKIIENPFFYPSYVFAKNREQYISNLEKISKNNDWNSWISFFIKAMTEQSKVSMNILRDLDRIKKETKCKIAQLRTSFSLQIIDFLFEKIKFDTSYFIKKTGIKDVTARALLRDLLSLEVISIETEGSGTISHVYKFDALCELVENIEK